VILVDANILIYATTPASRYQKKAYTWLDRQLNGGGPVGLPWASLLAFLRIVTDARIVSPPVPMATAWEQTLEWLKADSVWVPMPTDRHSALLGNLLSVAAAHSKLVPDAHLAALAIEHGLTLCSADSDFARFPDLRWVNPLAE
jgi:hypothetical protein